MREDLLERIRQEAYEEYLELKNYNRKVFRLNQLLSSDEMKEYFELTQEKPKKLKYVEINIEEIIYSLFEKYSEDIKSDETNDIYVYRGTYRYVKPFDYNQNSIVPRNSLDAEYSIYSNLEKYDLKYVSIENREEFEKNHNIVFGESYFNVRREFALMSVNESQEKAVNHILKKYKK